MKKLYLYEVTQFGKVLSILPAINKKDAHNKFFNIIVPIENIDIGKKSDIEIRKLS